MDTFIGSLIIIAIVMAVLLAVSAFFPYYPEGMPSEIRVLHEFTAGRIGYAENYVSRLQDYGSFGVGVPQEQELKAVPRMEITAALFGGNSEKFTISVPSYVMEWLKGGEISFTVDETNEYGNLIIAWNGEAVHNKKTSNGRYTIDLDTSQIKAENELQVSAQGPGMLFWAATAYNIEDFSVSADYGPAKFLDFEVSQDELESLDKFELSWTTTSSSGVLVTKVNGDEIFHGSPTRQEKIEFTDTGLQTASIVPGTNRLAFMAINGSSNLKSVAMRTYVSKNQRIMKERFELTGAQVESLRPRGGKVRLYVERIENDGFITAKLNEQSIGSVQAMKGWNDIEFGVDAVETGTNWLEISGSGTFDIGDASVEIA
jgi:hypothetical protein